MPTPSASLIAGDGHVAAYLARLLDARGVAVAATTVGAAMRQLGIADAIAPASPPHPLTGAIFAIDDGTPETDARIAAVLAALPGSAARLVHVVEAATLARRPAARARLRDIAVLRSEAGLAACSVVLHRHDSRLGPADSLPARIVEQAWRLANGGAADVLVVPDTPAQDWGWTAEYVEPIVQAASLGRDLVVATGHGLGARDIAQHACAFFRVDGADAFRFEPDDAAATDMPSETAIAATRAATGWRAVTFGRDLVRTLCEGAASRLAAG